MEGSHSLEFIICLSRVTLFSCSPVRRVILWRRPYVQLVDFLVPCMRYLVPTIPFYSMTVEWDLIVLKDCFMYEPRIVGFYSTLSYATIILQIKVYLLFCLIRVVTLTMQHAPTLSELYNYSTIMSTSPNFCIADYSTATSYITKVLESRIPAILCFNM